MNTASSVIITTPYRPLPAPPGGHQFDRLPRRDRTAENRLLAVSQGRKVLCTMEIIDHTEHKQNQCDNNRQRQQNAHHRTHQVRPEVADLLVLVLREAPDQRCGNAHPDRAACERLDTESDDQPHVPERGLARIVLPAGVGDKRNGGVEGQCRRHSLVTPGFRKPSLRQQESVEEEDADRREGQKREAVTRRPLPVIGLRADQTVDQPFNAPVAGIGIHPGHVVARGNMEDDDH